MPDDRLAQLAKNLKDDPPPQALDVETLTDAELARRRRGLEAMIESLEEVLTIDLKKLHEECAQQSGWFRMAGEASAEASYLAAKMKARNKLVRANVMLKIRQGNPATYGVDKFTEATVDALVEKDPEVIRVTSLSLECERDATSLGSLRDAFADRSWMIRGAVQLFQSEYFSPAGELTAPPQLVEQAIRDFRRTRANAQKGEC